MGTQPPTQKSFLASPSRAHLSCRWWPPAEVLVAVAIGCLPQGCSLLLSFGGLPQRCSLLLPLVASRRGACCCCHLVASRRCARCCCHWWSLDVVFVVLPWVATCSCVRCVAVGGLSQLCSLGVRWRPPQVVLSIVAFGGLSLSRALLVSVVGVLVLSRTPNQ